MASKPRDITLNVGPDGRELELFLRNLEKEWKKEDIVDDLSVIAEILISRAVESPIPTDLGDLAGSSVVETNASKGEVSLGFNKVYAAFQDADGKTEQVITPKRKKFLFVPISQKGRKHSVGRNPRDEGLVRGKDYILTKKVVVKTKPYGSPIGPNKYFSETLRRNKDFVFEELARRMSRRAEKAKRRST